MTEAAILEYEVPLESGPPFSDAAQAHAFRALIRGGLADPNHTASVLVDAHGPCTYGEVLEKVAAIARRLRALGLAPGDCVTAALANTIDSAVLALALLDGGYSVLVEPAHSDGREPPPVAFAKAMVRMAPRPQSGTHEASPATRLEMQANAAFDAAAPRPDPDRPRIYSRTSGSLGTAKIVARLYERYAFSVWNTARRLPIDATTRLALPTPIYHLFGLGTGLIASLCNGASIDLQERPNALRFVEREAIFEPNVALVIPTFCATLVRLRRRPRAYRCMLVGGDTTDPAMRTSSELLHGPLVNLYGSSEMGTVSVSDLVPHDDSNGAGCLLPGIALRLTRRDGDAPGEHPLGALELKSRLQFAGYVDAFGRRLEPPGAFAGEWFRTGDLARLLPGDKLQVLGRTDLSVNRNGLLLPFADVESRLTAIEGVEDAAVVAGAPGIRGSALVAFCVLAPHAELSPDDLRARFAAGAPAYAVPDEVRIVPALPTLPSGKVDRRALVGSLADRT